MNCLIRLDLLVVAGSLSALVLPDTALAGEADSQSANSVAHSFPASPFQPDLTPDCVLIEGDIQVHFEQYWALRYHGAHLHAVYGGDDVTFWPKGVVPYDFVTTGGGAVSAANQQAAINAMAAIAAHAGLTFRPAVAGDDDRIRFQDSNYNSSCVGVHGGAQIINIVSWGSQIAICHEIYHSLGFHHEQSRSDREDFVTINWDNICGSGASPACTAGSGCCGCVDENNNCIACRDNFEIEHAPRYGPYDFGSIMHYPGGAFSCNGAKTITVNPAYAAWQNLIGHATNFSYFDVIACRGLYPFAADRWLDKDSERNPAGTFERPYTDTDLGGALARVPSGGALFIRYNTTYRAVGTHRRSVTILAPNGATLGK